MSDLASRAVGRGRIAGGRIGVRLRITSTRECRGCGDQQTDRNDSTTLQQCHQLSGRVNARLQGSTYASAQRWLWTHAVWLGSQPNSSLEQPSRAVIYVRSAR